MNALTIYEDPNFARGPWDAEVDRLEWIDAKTGLNCMIIRNDHLGFLCGYVGLPPGHPHYDADYNDVGVEVHGGLTYGAMCSGKICHVPQPGEPEHLYWLGFDCGHAWDVAPSSILFREKYGLNSVWPNEDVYRDLPYVKAQVTALARQLRPMV